MKIGLVSDTHGLVRPELLSALQGVQHILHAGDIGKPEVIAQLEEIAPVTAIRGNVDRGGWAEAYPTTTVFEVDGFSIYLVHSEQWLDLAPDVAGFDMVLSGHSHKPSIAQRKGVLYVNPGSAGPRRFKLPVTCGLLTLEDGHPDVDLVELVAR